MSTKFIIRFAAILFSVLILTALAIQFFFKSDVIVVLWSFAVPFILGIPILASVVLTTNDELDNHSVY